MSNELTFYRDKPEKFRCQLSVEGISLDKTNIRLCLETVNNNYYFKGSIDEKGNCTIDIPPLKNVEVENGKAIVEIIADTNYFCPLEKMVNIKNSVAIKITENIEEKVEDIKPNISFKIIDDIETKTINNTNNGIIEDKKIVKVKSFKEFV